MNISIRITLICFAFVFAACSSHEKKAAPVPSVAKQEKIRIAIMRFKADGVSRSLADKTAELLRIEMVNTEKFMVVERNRLDLLLKEQGLQRSGCIDESCAVRIGKMLAANKILIGTVMKLGSKIVITAQIVDVEKGNVQSAAKQSADKESDLYSAAGTLAKKLTRKIAGVAKVRPGRDLDFRGKNLQGVRFRKADLRGADFTGANLQKANFTQAELEGAVFNDAHLQGANFRRADLSEASFKNAHLQKTNFRRADLEGTNFQNANLNGARIDKKWKVMILSQKITGGNSIRWR